MCQRHAQLSIGSLQATEQEYRRDTQRDRHDRLAQVMLVVILMQAQPRTCLVAVDQAGIRHEAGKAGMRGGGSGQLQENRGHRRPWLAAEWVERIVAIAPAIADPAQWPRIGHAHRHAKTAGGDQVAERCLRHDRTKCLQQRRFVGQCKPAQDYRAFAQGLIPANRRRRSGEQVGRDHVASWKMMPSVCRWPLRTRLTP